MCGVVGVLYSDGARSVDPHLLSRMCSAIRHRGPDDDGFYLKGPIGLGVRRLSIIDLQGGHQPIFSEDRSKALVFNGEIYNYRDLTALLRGGGHVFRSRCDAETVVHLYEQMGADCVHRLRGMFAFAIWDETGRALLLARDRFGIKPLYYITGPWGIAFASELKAIAAAGLSQRRLDWEALDMYLELGYIAAPRTPFSDIRKLEPGHVLKWSPGAPPVLKSYWDLPRNGASPPREAARETLRWIDESVAAHLTSDVPIATFLSGGLDSSAVVASTSILGESTHAFTARYVGSEARGTDETDLARKLASRYGTALTIVDVSPALQNILEPLVWTLDEPHADDSVVPTWALSLVVGAQYKVAMTGIGGDELFAGYRRHIALLLAAQYARLPPALRGGLGAVVERIPEWPNGHLSVDRLKRFVQNDGDTEADRFLGLVRQLADGRRLSLFQESLQATISGASARDRFRSLQAGGAFHDRLSTGLYLDYKTFLPDEVLAVTDRIGMAHSLEVRVPFVDHELVSRVFPLPARVKVGLGRMKRLLKDALRPRLPPEHMWAPKRGFVGPTAAWLRGELKSLLLDELSSARLGRLGYFAPKRVDTLVREHLERRHNRERILWALVCFSVWHRLYVESPPQLHDSRALDIGAQVADGGLQAERS